MIYLTVARLPPAFIVEVAVVEASGSRAADSSVIRTMSG